MYDLKPAEVGRAIDVLRTTPLTAADFSMRMWPDRERAADGKLSARGQHSLAGNALLQRLWALGYVERVGDLWMVRRISGSAAGPVAGPPAAHLQAHLPGYPAVFPAGSLPGHIPVDSAAAPPALPAAQQPTADATASADRVRLVRLVELATEPLESVTHDAVLGNLALRGSPVDDAIAEACSFVTLYGRNANVYPPCGAPQMIVALTPGEAARVLHIRWLQSGRPPDLYRASAWIQTADGIVACSSSWRPANAPMSWVDPEDVRDRVARLRRAAGLA